MLRSVLVISALAVLACNESKPAPPAATPEALPAGPVPVALPKIDAKRLRVLTSALDRVRATERLRSRDPALHAISRCAVLRAVTKKPLPRRPTTRDAMLAVAGLGGHLENNGDPRWLVLGRGMHDLLLLEMAWRAREDAEKSSTVREGA